MIFAVFGVEADVVGAADTQIDLCLGHWTCIRAKPLHDFLGLGPRGVDLFRRRIETTFEGEAWLGDGVCAGDGHESSSTNAARRSSCFDQNCAYRFSHSMASSMGAAVSSHDTTRPFFERRIRLASDSTSRCFMIAGSETGNGFAISLTDIPS